MSLFFRWGRVVMSFLFFFILALAAFNHRLTVYLIRQARGQLNVIVNRQSFDDYQRNNLLNEQAKRNLELIQEVKKYSVDSLGYKPTGNFTSIFDQKNKPVLWVVTAAGNLDLEPYEWKFPLLGKLSYKGFFEKWLAAREYISLVNQGYDVELRPVSAWSTLGILRDPVLSNMLQKSKGALSNLLFHELFHATYYAPGSVDLNENLANFVAHKATIRFLQNDTSSLNEYLRNYQDNVILRNFLLRQKSRLEKMYDSLPQGKEAFTHKRRAFMAINDSMELLPVKNKRKIFSRKKELLSAGNASFVDLRQYDSMQDSLEKVFNKNYRGNLKNLVRDLTPE